MLGVDPGDLETVNGVIWVKGCPDKSITWNKAIKLRTILGHGRFNADYTFANCMMSFVEVEVDTETGKVELLRVVNATDVGQIIDPPGIKGQLNGCLGTAGIDSAIFEETIVDQSKGYILNSNMIDYKWRTSLELPPIDNIIMETPFSTHRYRAVGVGEIATSPGPSAVLMAASNAISKWLHEYPVTPERVLKALGKVSPKKGKGGSV
jgi:xanthine dehydrogenase molybdenum-binding subunit